MSCKGNGYEAWMDFFMPTQATVQADIYVDYQFAALDSRVEV